MTSDSKLVKIINERDKELRHLRAELSSALKKVHSLGESYSEMKQRYINEFQKRPLNKLRNKLENYLSILAVFLTPGKEETTLPKRLSMFFKTMWSWCKSGFKLEEEQVYSARFEICKACPELKKPQNQCGICGCFMEKKTKLSGASCPLKKW